MQRTRSGWRAGGRSEERRANERYNRIKTDLFIIFATGVTVARTCVVDSSTHALDSAAVTAAAAVSLEYVPRFN